MTKRYQNVGKRFIAKPSENPNPRDGDVGKVEGVVDLLDAVSYHQLVVASEGRTVATQRQYLYFERVFLKYLDAARLRPTLDTLNPTNVRAALAWYGTQRDYRRRRGGEVGGMVLIDTLHLFARFLEREGIYEEDPLRKLRRVKIAKRLRQPFTQSEVIAMWGACRTAEIPSREEALFLLLLDTGMRIGEACTLTLDRVKFDARQIIIGTEGKGRRERLVPIGASDKRDGGRTLRALRRYVSERPDDARGRGRLFLGRDRYPLESAGGSAAISRLGKTADIVDAGPHRLRHTFCTQYLVTYPGDELGLRRIVGHLSFAVLADYVHFAQSIIAERAGRASLAEQWLTPSTDTSPKVRGSFNGTVRPMLQPDVGSGGSRLIDSAGAAVQRDTSRATSRGPQRGSRSTS